MCSRANHPLVYITAMVLLHQEKVLCGKGKDSFAQQKGLRSSKLEDVEKSMRDEWFDGGAMIVDVPRQAEVCEHLRAARTSCSSLG
jgi:hypothetical protein